MKVVCSSCAFGLFSPIVEDSVSTLGLYDDARFWGRSFLMLNKHYENIEDILVSLSNAYMEDIKLYVKVLKKALNVERVNVSILGNTVPHIHAHLVPRYPDQEKFPGKSPWNDPRPLFFLEAEDKSALIEEMRFVRHSTLS